MKKHIPNCITLLNLLCGVCGCILAMWKQYYPAMLFLIAAAAFDFLDGFCARLLDAYSEIGKQLDSLSDLISFGLAPSLMFFNWYLNTGHGCTALAYTALLIVTFAALRLAKFNVDDRQSTDFIGLPTPAAAMIAAPLTAYGQVCTARGIDSTVTSLLNSGWFIPAASALLAFLMISEIPMISMKHKKMSFRQFPKETIFLVCFVTIALLVVPFCSTGKETGLGFFYSILPLTLVSAFTLYILINIAAIGTTKGKYQTERRQAAGD